MFVKRDANAKTVKVFAISGRSAVGPFRFTLPANNRISRPDPDKVERFPRAAGYRNPSKKIDGPRRRLNFLQTNKLKWKNIEETVYYIYVYSEGRFF